jgi:hypothetical protein
MDVSWSGPRSAESSHNRQEIQAIDVSNATATDYRKPCTQFQLGYQVRPRLNVCIVGPYMP